MSEEIWKKTLNMRINKRMPDIDFIFTLFNKSIFTLPVFHWTLEQNETNLFQMINIISTIAEYSQYSFFQIVLISINFCFGQNQCPAFTSLKINIICLSSDYDFSSINALIKYIVFLLAVTPLYDFFLLRWISLSQNGLPDLQ